MGWFKVLGNLLGIGKTALENRQKLKQAKVDSKIKIEEARANAQVNRINSNTVSDNELDRIKVEQQGNSIMDELVSIIFLMPLIVVTITPFIVCYKTGEWVDLSKELIKSYKTLQELEIWFIGGIFLVITNILGFRSFLRKAFTAWLDKTMAKAGLINKVIDGK